MRGLQTVRRGISVNPPLWQGLARSVLAVIVPTGLRWLLVGNYLGVPFVLYFPVILLIAVNIGWRYAVLTAIGCAVVGVHLFWPAFFDLTASQQAAVLGMFAVSIATMIFMGQLLRDSILAIEAQARQSEDFNRELQHRTKNSLQMMRALASQASKATDPAEFYSTLGGRLAALAKSNELLRFGAAEACEMDELMREATAPFDTARISYAGPPCSVSRNGCTPLMMALHELGTNASKYGALSVPEGRVAIVWEAAERHIEIDWQETGGPRVAGTPARKGIGARLLTPNGDMNEVEVRYDPGGVCCTLRIARS